MPQFRLTWQQVVALIALAVILAVAWIYRQPLMLLLRDLEAARTWLLGLGAWGPLVLILINALQIVIAPIPGYVVQVAAGWVFGIWLGALYGTIGLALGAILATSLTRTLGRPFAARMVGEARLERWGHMIHADSAWLWAGLFLAPVGDTPYFLAGLSHYPIRRLVPLAVIVRAPSVLVASAVGAGVIGLGTADPAACHHHGPAGAVLVGALGTGTARSDRAPCERIVPAVSGAVRP